MTDKRCAAGQAVNDEAGVSRGVLCICCSVNVKNKMEKS